MRQFGGDYEGVCVGKVGMKIDLEVVVAGHSWRVDGKQRYYFLDEAKNILSWRTTKRMHLPYGSKVRLRGRIRSHYSGWYGMETSLWYCKITREV